MHIMIYLVSLEKLHIKHSVQTFVTCQKEGLVRGIWKNHSHEKTVSTCYLLTTELQTEIIMTIAPDHTCHISHSEIKSHRIWPIWKAIPIKNSNLTEFSDNFTTDFMKNIHKSHTVVVFISFLHEQKNNNNNNKKKHTLYYIGGAPK